MLDAKDLRIGNHIIYDGRIGIVKWFTNKSFLLKMEFSTLNHTSRKGWVELPLEPIELTEQWLLDFGYKQVNTLANGTKVFEKLGLFTVYYKDGIVRFSFYTIDVKFVHKFQNIIYSLTNTELTLKDKP